MVPSLTRVRLGFVEVSVRELARWRSGERNPERTLWELRDRQAVVQAGDPHRQGRGHPPVDASISWQIPAPQPNSLVGVSARVRWSAAAWAIRGTVAITLIKGGEIDQLALRQRRPRMDHIGSSAAQGLGEWG